MPSSTISCGGVLRDVLAAEADPPAAGWLRPLIERSVVDLPAPFAPISVTISPARTSSEIALERLDRPVVGVDALELEDRRRAGRVLVTTTAAFPRYASITRGSVWTSCGGPLGDLLAVVEHGDRARRRP